MTAREQADEVDVAGLRGVAEAAIEAPMSSTERLLAWDTYMGATYPDVILALLDRLELAEAAVARVEALAKAAKRDEATSLSRTFDGGTFGAWVSADQILAALTGADQ